MDTWAIVVAQLAERPRFESSHQQLLLDQYFLELFVENKEKETGNGPLKNSFRILWLHLTIFIREHYAQCFLTQRFATNPIN